MNINIMKTKSIVYFGLLALLSFSCSKDDNEGPLWEKSDFVRITATTEQIIGTNLKQNWLATDSIVVFDHKNVGTKLYTTDNNVASAIYYTHEWPASRPVYASFPYTGEGDLACSCTDGVIGVKLESDQKFNPDNTYLTSAIVSVGRITGNSSAYKLEPMMNVMGLIKISISYDNAKSIKVESVAGETLAGYVDVDYEKLLSNDPSFWTSTKDKQQYTAVTLTPEVSSNSEASQTETPLFSAGSYYLALFPQTYSKGLRITITYADGNTIVRTLQSDANDSGITIPRNGIVEFASALDDTLPETMEVNLQFYNDNNVNPLGNFVESKSQVVEGESYTCNYEYTLDGEKLTEPLEFIISKGASSATYSYVMPSGVDKNILIFGAQNNAWIKLPGITGRYLKSVTLIHGNTAAKRFRVQEACTSPVGLYFSSPLIAAPALDSPVTETVTFPTGSTDKAQIDRTVMGKSYTIQFTSGTSLRVFSIKLVYAKSLD